jgi:pimeloyl-ACP methyl ester carboxylesterase
MGHLQEAHEKFKDKIVFLSLSLDRKPEDVTKFRAEKWKMDWFHAFLGEEVNKPITKIFEVMSIPKPILVNPEGIMVEVGGSLRGINLENIFDGVHSEKTFDKPTLFIRGEKSDYIKYNDFDLIYRHFPQADIVTIEGVGHWMHAEKPDEFYNIVNNFLQRYCPAG